MVGRWSAMESVTYLISSWLKFKFLLQTTEMCALCGEVCGFFLSQAISSMECIPT